MLPVLVGVGSKMWVCARWLAGIAGSNPAWQMNISLVSFVCVVRKRSLRRADLSSRGFLPSVVYLSVIM